MIFILSWSASAFCLASNLSNRPKGQQIFHLAGRRGAGSGAGATAGVRVGSFERNFLWSWRRLKSLMPRWLMYDWTDFSRGKRKLSVVFLSCSFFQVPVVVLSLYFGWKQTTREQTVRHLWTYYKYLKYEILTMDLVTLLLLQRCPAAAMDKSERLLIPPHSL